MLLAYYDPAGRLVYAGRAGTCIDTAELQRLWRRLQPLATDKMPLDVPPPRGSRFATSKRWTWGASICVGSAGNEELES